MLITKKLQNQKWRGVEKQKKCLRGYRGCVTAGGCSGVVCILPRGKCASTVSLCMLFRVG